MEARVELLVGSFSQFIDDPALLAALGDLRADLTIERGDRNVLRANFGKITAS